MSQLLTKTLSQYLASAEDLIEEARAGRWSGMDKVECGIHLGQRQAAA